MTEIIDIDKIAALSGLSVSSEERAALSRDIEEMIAFVEKISLAEGGDTDTPFFPHREINVFREDIPQKSVDRELLLSAAGDTEGGYISVPRVIGNGGGDDYDA